MNEVTFNCPPHCGQSLEVDKNMGGMKVECPACNRPLKVPGAKLRYHSRRIDGPSSQSHPKHRRNRHGINGRNVLQKLIRT